MKALLNLRRPDLTSAFWKVPRVSTDLIVTALGVRLNHDQWARVQRARLVLEQSVGDLSTPVKLVRNGRAVG